VAVDSDKMMQPTISLIFFCCTAVKKWKGSYRKWTGGFAFLLNFPILARHPAGDLHLRSVAVIAGNLLPKAMDSWASCFISPQSRGSYRISPHLPHCPYLLFSRAEILFFNKRVYTTTKRSSRKDKSTAYLVAPSSNGFALLGYYARCR